MTELTQAEVRRLFDYDPDTGALTWRIRRGRATVGACVGSLQSEGYFQTKINYKRYLVHRLIWLWWHGETPKDQIDHINHDRIDNRIANMREATNKGNGRNQSMRNDNMSGVTGVCWTKRRGKWLAYIRVDGHHHNLGEFTELSVATAVRKAAERQYGFHQNHGAAA